MATTDLRAHALACAWLADEWPTGDGGATTAVTLVPPEGSPPGAELVDLAGAVLTAGRRHARYPLPPTMVALWRHAPVPHGRRLHLALGRSRAGTAAVTISAADALARPDDVVATGTVEVAGHDLTHHVADLVELAGATVPPRRRDLRHPCVACGEGGLGLEPAVGDRGWVSAPWMAEDDIADDAGSADPAALVSVLGCAARWATAVAAPLAPAVVDGIHVRFRRELGVLDPVRAVARPDDADGRRAEARSALVDLDGRVHAIASVRTGGVAVAPP